MLPPELELPLAELEFCSLSVSMATGSQELRLRRTPDLHRENWKLSQARERTKLYFTALHKFFFTGIPQHQVFAQLCYVRDVQVLKSPRNYTHSLNLLLSQSEMGCTDSHSFYCHATVGSYGTLNSSRSRVKEQLQLIWSTIWLQT